MSDPKRLSGGDDLGAALLGSARRDAPRTGSRARTAAALGLGVGVAVGTAAGTAAAKAAGASVAPKAIGSAGVAAKAATALWLKLLAGGVVALAVAGGVAVKVKTSAHHADATIAERNRAPEPTSPPLGPAPAPEPAPEPAPAIAPAPPPDSAAIPSTAAPEAPRSAPRAQPMTTPATAIGSAAPPESPLARELRSLDHARSALARGDASGALVELDRHDRAFATGPLRTEANVLRVEALLARGDRAAARKLAAELLARDPSGPHAKRLRTVADGTP